RAAFTKWQECLRFRFAPCLGTMYGFPGARFCTREFALVHGEHEWIGRVGGEYADNVNGRTYSGRTKDRLFQVDGKIGFLGLLVFFGNRQLEGGPGSSNNQHRWKFQFNVRLTVLLLALNGLPNLIGSFLIGGGTGGVRENIFPIAERQGGGIVLLYCVHGEGTLSR